LTTREHAAFGAALGLAMGFLARDLDLTTLISFSGDRMILLPLGTIVGSICASTRLRKPFFALFAGLALLWVLVAYTPLSRLLITGLVRSDVLREADAVLVFSSNIQDDGDPTSVQLARLYRGLELVRDGLAPRLIITELPEGDFARQRPFVANMLARYRPEVELVALGPVRNTHDEALAAIAYMRSKGLKRLILTTSATHTFRAAALFDGQGLEVMATPSMETRFDLQNLGRSEERLAAFGQVIHERLGLFVYRRRGWIR
jgi:uncharacterized SAM-binding protein YcdF (DUF218 family)